MASVQLPNADPSVLTNGLKPEHAEHKEPAVYTNGNGHSNGHTPGNDDLEFTNGIVKEALAYSGRGRPLRV